MKKKNGKQTTSGTTKRDDKCGKLHLNFVTSYRRRWTKLFCSSQSLIMYIRWNGVVHWCQSIWTTISAEYERKRESVSALLCYCGTFQFRVSTCKSFCQTLLPVQTMHIKVVQNRMQVFDLFPTNHTESFNFQHIPSHVRYAWEHSNAGSSDVMCHNHMSQSSTKLVCNKKWAIELSFAPLSFYHFRSTFFLHVFYVWIKNCSSRS